MPSIAQQANGDMPLASQHSNGYVESHTNEKVDLSRANGDAETYQDHDAFQHLPRPQQDVLLLHGPRQKYSLQTTGQIPELRAEREILVQVRYC